MKGRENGEAIAYLHGYIAAKLDAFAESSGIPKAQLAARLGALLLGAADREVLGSDHPVSSVRRKTAKGDQAARAVEMAVGAPRGPSKSGYWSRMTEAERSAEVGRRLALRKPAKGKRQLSPEGRARIAAASKRRWAREKASRAA